MDQRLARGFAVGYLVWAALVAVVAGFIGAGLNCEGGDGCHPTAAPRFQPWTWGEYSVFFAGLTESGRMLFALGPLLALPPIAKLFTR